MALDRSRLVKVRVVAGKTIAQCPACAEGGADSSCEHLVLFEDGAYGCCVHREDSLHRKRIFELVGIRDGTSNGHSVKSPSREKKPKASDKTASTPFEKAYVYQDANGDKLYETRRYVPKDFRPFNPKTGWLSLQGVTVVPYHLPELIASQTAWIVEGEKDADSLMALGITATCRAQGTSIWEPELTRWFVGKDVIFCGDNDKDNPLQPGPKFRAMVEVAIKPVAKSWRSVYVPEPDNDISEALEGLSDTEAHEFLKTLLALPDDGIRRRSLAEYAQMEVNAADTLLGDRWLCRTGAALFVAPSGIGKSSAGAQMDALWSLGRTAFGIRPAKPLRILTIQVENDEGDLIEMADGVLQGLGLNDSDLCVVETNTNVVTIPGKTGESFFRQLRSELKNYPADLLRIDPASAFNGAEIKDSAATNQFCRQLLQPLLIEFNVGCILTVHTPKTNHRDTTEWKPHDWAYAAAGAADWTNYARAVLVIDPAKYPLFKFIASKRGNRIGWMNEDGSKSQERFFQHNTGDHLMFWTDATPEIKKGSCKKCKEDLLSLFPVGVTVKKHEFLALCQDEHEFTRSQIRDFCNALLGAGLLVEKKIEKGASTRPFVGLVRIGLVDVGGIDKISG